MNAWDFVCCGLAASGSEALVSLGGQEEERERDETLEPLVVVRVSRPW